MQATVAFLLAGALVQAGGVDAMMRPEPGDPAPAFSAEASTGATIRLADFLGKSKVILAFFPKAFTGG